MLLAFGAAVGLSLVLYLITRSGQAGGAELAQRYDQFREYTLIVNAILSILLLMSGPMVILETLLTGSDGIAREHRTGAWDALVLTPLSAWQIITGKWRAVQAYIYRHYGRLLALRALVYFWLSVSSAQSAVTGDRPDVFALVGGVILVVSFTALNQALAGAASLLASFQRGPLATFGGAAAVYLVMMLVVAAGNLLLLQPLLSGMFGLDAMRFMSVFMLATFDGGIMAATLTQSHEVNTWTLAAFALLNALLYGALIYALLRLARWLAIRNGAAT